MPFPDERLSQIALRALSVDKELSPLVDRTFEITSPEGEDSDAKSSLRVVYRATTNRMLRVSVNGFFESLRLVVQVMEDLDADVAMDEDRKDNGELVCYYHNHLYRKFTSLQVENVAEALNPLWIRLRPHESQRTQRSHSGLHLLV